MVQEEIPGHCNGGIKVRFCSLASGSTGNSYFVGDEDGGLLVDAGLSAKAIEQCLLEGLGMTPHQLVGILVTHEHIDHIKSIGTLARRYHLPVYATSGTWQGMQEKIGTVPEQQRRILPDRDGINIGRFDVEWFATAHDANEPVAYVVHRDEQKISIATDTGVLNQQMIGKLYNSDVVIVEANHDVEMVRTGRYPLHLKRRILSETGHLSNKACGEGLQEIIGGRTRHVVLAHLSMENNLPDLAHQTVKDILLGSRLTGSLKLWVAKAQAQSVSLDI